MSSYNRVILVGNVTRDPEFKLLASGTSVCELGIAVNDRFKNGKGEWVDDTTFVDVTLWGRTAEVAKEFLTKGAPVLIEGRLKLDTWEKDGQKRSKLKVNGEKMQMLGSRKGSSEEQPQQRERRQSRETVPANDYGGGEPAGADSYADIPF